MSTGPLQGRIQQARNGEPNAADTRYCADLAKYNPERSGSNRAARAPMTVPTIDEKVERILTRICNQLRPMIREAIESRMFGKVVSETLFQNGKEKSGDAKYNRTYLYDSSDEE